MSKIGIIVMLFSICCWGCKAKKDVVQTGQKEIEQTENNTKRCFDEENGLFWTENTDRVAEKYALKLSNNFKLFTVDELNLRKMVDKNAKRRNDFFKFGLPVYINGKVECKFFKLINSETISLQTQIRNGVFTFKGEELSDPMQTGRFDYELNRGMRAYIQLGKDTYIFEPISVEGSKYYISYNKKDTEALKKQFDLK